MGCCLLGDGREGEKVGCGMMLVGVDKVAYREKSRRLRGGGKSLFPISYHHSNFLLISHYRFSYMREETKGTKKDKCDSEPVHVSGLSSVT